MVGVYLEYPVSLAERESKMKSCRFLTALPVYNEAEYIDEVLDEVSKYSDDVLIVDDGSTDGSDRILDARPEVAVVRHATNRGYGAALISAFQYAMDHDYDVVVTIDCDGQHEPQLIRRFVETICETGADIVSGSRYLNDFDSNTPVPEQRRAINRRITQFLNERLNFNLTDAFCGFKAYRVSSLGELEMTETGYAMPLELWVQAACAKLKIVEVAVPLIYLDEARSFGGKLDDPEYRIRYYNQILVKSLKRLPERCSQLLVGS